MKKIFLATFTGLALLGSNAVLAKPDATGSIVIDIDDDLWKPLQLKAGDKVRVVGEVDTHRVKPTDIEVFKIERIK